MAGTAMPKAMQAQVPLIVSVIAMIPISWRLSTDNRLSEAQSVHSGVSAFGSAIEVPKA
jgi:hypothetical protein